MLPAMHLDEVILEILGLAHQYGFLDLETAISDYLKAILNIRNVCLIYDTASLYQGRQILVPTNTCFQYLIFTNFLVRYMMFGDREH